MATSLDSACTNEPRKHAVLSNTVLSNTVSSNTVFLNVVSNLKLARLLAAAMFCAVTCSGCVGILYTDITTPLVTNMRNTPNENTSKQTELSQERVQEPFFGISVEVDSIAIGDAAKKAGLHEVYYADLRTVSILFGIYVKRTIIVTGN